MMINPVYDLKTLFEQLGLPSEQTAMDEFINNHQIADDVILHEAEFWTEEQQSFLRSALIEDQMWAVPMDELNVRLHA